MKDDNIIGWFSLENGQHVPLREGESKREATSKFLNKKMSRVERNKDKYDKIDNFKKRKQSNNKIDTERKEGQTKIRELEKNSTSSNNDEDFDKKVVGLEKIGNTYIPIREGENVDNNSIYEKNLNEEREKFYQTYADFYEDEHRTRNRGDGIYYAKLSSDELRKELESKLDKKLENNEKITKQDVKTIIEDFRKRKASNIKPMPKFEGSEIEKLKQEKEYIENEISDLESANVFMVRDNPANQDNYLLRRKNYMNLKDRSRYEKLEERKAEIERLLSE